MIRSRRSAIPHEDGNRANGKQQSKKLVPSASVDVVKTPGGHGDRWKKRGQRPDPVRYFRPIDGVQGDADENDEERRKPELRSARSAGEIHIFPEIAADRLAETHCVRRAAEAVRPGRRFSEDEDQRHDDQDQEDQPVPQRKTAHKIPPAI